MRHVWIGTSGWTYKDWRSSFYPLEVPAKKWLSWYAGRFPTTEINGSFYRTPSLEAVRSWRDQTPDHFVFAWKASKFITHWKRLTVYCYFDNDQKTAAPRDAQQLADLIDGRAPK